MITYIPDMSEQAIELLLSQYQRAPRFISWIEALVSGSQMLEDMAFDLLISDNPTDAKGATLERWGRIVGQMRQGLNDEEYGQFIEAKMTANIGDSNIEKVLKIWSMITALSDVKWFQVQGGIALVAWRSSPMRSALWTQVRDFMEGIRPAGLNLTMTEAGLQTMAFRFDLGPGFDAGELARWL